MMHLLHTLDFFGTLLCLISTVLYVKAHYWAWPIGILATLSDGVLYAFSGLYADTALQAIYFLSMFYGWYLWRRGGVDHDPLPIRRSSGVILICLAGLTLLGIFLVSQVLIRYTPSQVPYWDASTMVLSLSAQWLTCKKRIESWVLWFAVDIMYLGLYYYKAIPFHSGLNVLYLGMAVAGFWNWRRLMRQQASRLQRA